MITLPPLINGKSHEWNDVTMNILGAPFITVTAIKYSDKYDIKDNYGAGPHVINYGYGNYSAEASVTIQFDEVETLINAAPLGRIQLIPPFDIIVTMVSPTFTTVKHKLRNCRFMDNTIDTKNGDQKIDVSLNLAISDIVWI